MNIKTFLKELLFYFPMTKKLGDGELEKLFNAYTEDILYEINKWDGYNCDFQILLRKIRSNYQYEKFPSIATILNYLPKAKVKIRKNEIADEGCTIRVTLDNGYYYDFTVVSFDTQTTVGNIKKRFTYKDSAGTTKSKIKKIVYYPKGITFIGGTIFYEKDEEELKKQIKTLFVAP